MSALGTRGEDLDGAYFDAAAEGGSGPHTWEGPMARSWDTIEEDEKGELKSHLLTEQRAKKARLQAKQLVDAGGAAAAAGAAGAGAGAAPGVQRIIEKGMIRYVYVVLDLSGAMDVTDIRPTRKQATLQLMEEFIREFFDQNPISQIGLIVAYKKIAEKVTELSGNPLQQIKLLNAKHHAIGGGEMSLQNALEIARGSLAAIPVYGSREVVVISGSLGTVDPGDIFETVHALQRARVRCSVIGLAAEMHVCTVLTKTTGGTYGVAMSREHFKELLAAHVTPRPVDATSKVQRKWIRMGFPQKRVDPYPSLCACHMELTYGGYFCPKCATKYCELPTDCSVCALTLVSSPHLARSYHHLFAVQPYDERALPGAPLTPAAAATAAVTTTAITTATAAAPATAAAAATAAAGAGAAVWRGACTACLAGLVAGQTLVVWCGRCNSPFCVDCDVFVHEQLHNCPGCLSRAPPPAPAAAAAAAAK